jgi:hypothetical protein
MISGFWRAKKRHIEDSGDEEMIMVSQILMKLKRCSGWTRRSCQLLNTEVMTKRQEVACRGNGRLIMEDVTKAINSSSHSRLFAMQWNRYTDKREVTKANEYKFCCN